MIIDQKKYSPNFSREKRSNKDIKFIVIHYTGMQSRIASLNRLLNSRYKVSCHFFIDRKGKVTKMVEENKVAWHAGKSRWKHFENLNKNSIGIELVNKGHQFAYQNFTNKQISKLVKLCIYLKKKYKIKISNILGHSDIAPLRKKDPGEKFPWKKLAKKKLGIWYKSLNFNIKEKNKKILKEKFFNNLFKIGYRYFQKKRRNKNDSLIIKAFQRRYLPEEVTGSINQKTYVISHFLAKNTNI